MKITIFLRKNEVINKRAAVITWKCKNLLHMQIKH